MIIYAVAENGFAPEPGVKRKLALNMPPMAHLGQENLFLVADYILEVTKGKKYIPEKEPEDPYKKYIPKIQRIFMPNAGPAAIAVSLNDNLHFCWDAGTCQLRYIWNGGYIDQWPVNRGNGNALAKVNGKSFVQLSKGNSFIVDGKVSFHGYELVDGKPIFSFSVGSVNITASFSTKSSDELTIHFTTDSNESLKYSPQITQGEWHSNKGEKRDGILHLTVSESKSFNVTFQKGAE
jgi:hypothetical protein